MAVRRVRRVIRRFDPWTVLKVSFVFNAISSLVFVLGTWVLWSIVVQRGIPDRIVSLLDEVANIVFTPDGELYFRIVVLFGVLWAVLMTGVMTLGAVLYNLIADLVGGIEVVVLEETYTVAAQPQEASRKRPRVRPAVHREQTAQQQPPQKPTPKAPQRAAQKPPERTTGKGSTGAPGGPAPAVPPTRSARVS